jgi:hypothetical protein
LQTGVLTAGLLFAVNIAYKIAIQHSRTARQAFLAILPQTGFMTSIVIIFLRIYIG